MIDKNLDDNIIELGLSAFVSDQTHGEFPIKSNNYKMSSIKKVFQWLVYSSANPQLISLTIKGFIPLLLLLGADASMTDELGNAVTDTIVAIGIVLSSFLTLGGLLRKIYFSLK